MPFLVLIIKLIMLLLK